MEKENSFLGRGWSFPPTFSNTGIVGVEMVEKELDIEQSLEVLLNTGKGRITSYNVCYTKLLRFMFFYNYILCLT